MKGIVSSRGFRHLQIESFADGSKVRINESSSCAGGFFMGLFDETIRFKMPDGTTKTVSTSDNTLNEHYVTNAGIYVPQKDVIKLLKFFELGLSEATLIVGHNEKITIAYDGCRMVVKNDKPSVSYFNNGWKELPSNDFEFTSTWGLEGDQVTMFREILQGFEDHRCLVWPEGLEVEYIKE